MGKVFTQGGGNVISLIVLIWFLQPNTSIFPPTKASQIAVFYSDHPFYNLKQEPLETQVSRVYLPIIIKPRDHFYVQGINLGNTYYGVWANITTADPKIREELFSYASINIRSINNMWIEAGWIKSPIYGCVPKFLWATQPGIGNPITSPQPVVGHAYGYMIYRVSPGNWKIKILNMSGYVLVEIDVSNPGMDYGLELQGTGEVHSVRKWNDMGVSNISSLLWRRFDGVWQSWGSWSEGIVDDPPYSINGIQYDPNAYIQVSGNQGNPIPTDAPCP